MSIEKQGKRYMQRKPRKGDEKEKKMLQNMLPLGSYLRTTFNKFFSSISALRNSSQKNTRQQ